MTKEMIMQKTFYEDKLKDKLRERDRVFTEMQCKLDSIDDAISYYVNKIKSMGDIDGTD